MKSGNLDLLGGQHFKGNRLQGAVAVTGDDSTQLSVDGEEARLLKIVAACMDAVNVARHALHEPSHSLLTPEFRKLAKDLEVALDEWAKAMAALREYRLRQASADGEEARLLKIVAACM